MKRWLRLTLVCCVLLCLFLSLPQAAGLNHGLQIVGLRPEFDQGKEPDLRRHSLGCQKPEIRCGSHWIPRVSGARMCVDCVGNLGPPGPETHGSPEPIGLGRVAGLAVNRQLQLTPRVHSSPRIYCPKATNFEESEFRNSL
jgi:hypothetical protein